MPWLFQEEDLDGCVELYGETFAAAPWNEVWAPEVVRARLEQIVRTPGFYGVVMEPEEGGLNGFALGISEPWHEGTHFYLKEMCVSPGYQRQGVGTALMAALSEALEDRDTKRIYLLTARGDLSEAFYAKQGFYVSPKMILMARRKE
ncbi:MAG: family acetyltransferase [Akkermansiaceae bacterium]|nr:family acetyltransferase [Akkermansiaceae bacterium]